MKTSALIFVSSLVLLPAAHASLTFTATFDPAFTPAEVAAINAALDMVQAGITSPNALTVNLDFMTMSGGLGQSTSAIYEMSYFDFYNALAAVASQPDQLAALASLGTAPADPSAGNPVNGYPGLLITSAEARNLGFADPGYLLGSYDSVISLNLAATSPPNSLSGSYSLETVAAHEIDEALGIGGTGSTLFGSGDLTGPVGDLDLYRYSAPGVRSYSNASADQPYFSIDGGNTVASYFNQIPGADYADWASAPIPAGFSPQVQDAFATPGVSLELGPGEITAFNAIGYDSAAPEPSTIVLSGTLLGFLLFLRRRPV